MLILASELRSKISEKIAKLILDLKLLNNNWMDNKVFCDCASAFLCISWNILSSLSGNSQSFPCYAVCRICVVTLYLGRSMPLFLWKIIIFFGCSMSLSFKRLRCRHDICTCIIFLCLYLHTHAYVELCVGCVGQAFVFVTPRTSIKRVRLSDKDNI